VGTAGGHEPPYPGTPPAEGDDPRPYWARTWMRNTNREIGEIKKTVGEMDTKLDQLLTEKARREGVAITWKGLAVAISGVVGLGSIIALLIAVLNSLPSGPG